MSVTSVVLRLQHSDLNTTNIGSEGFDSPNGHPWKKFTALLPIRDNDSDLPPSAACGCNQMICKEIPLDALG